MYIRMDNESYADGIPVSNVFLVEHLPYIALVMHECYSV